EVRFATTLPAQDIELRLDYAADFNVGSEGIYRVKLGTDAYAISQMEAISARLAFPGFDEPRFKTPFDVVLTTRRSDAAFANTRPVHEEISADGQWKTTTFATTRPLPTYLIAFAAGPYDVVDAGDVAPNDVRAMPLPLRVIGPRGSAAELAWIAGQAPAIVTYFEQYTRQPYPFDKLDLLGLPNFAASGMENAGLIMFDDVLLRFDAGSP